MRVGVKGFLSVESRVIRGSFILSLGSIASLAIAAVGSVVIARILGPDNYGLIPVVMVAPNVLMVLSDLGLSTALTRYSSIPSGGRATYIVTGVLLKTLLGLAATVTLWLTAGYVASALGRPYAEHYIRISSLLILANAIVSASTSALIGLGGYLESATVQVALTILRVVVAVGLVMMGFGVLGAVLGHVVAWSLMAVVALALLLYSLGVLAPPSLRVAREMVRYSIPLHLPAIIGVPLGQFYYSILARVSSNWDLGNLGVAGNVMAPVNSIGGAILASLLSSLPLLIGDKAGLVKAVERAVVYTALVMPALAGGVIVVAEPLITMLYGPSYSLAPLYTSIMALTVMIAPLGSYVWSSYLASLGKTTDILKAQLLGAIVGVPVYVALTLTAGVVGYLASNIIVSVITTLYMLKVAVGTGVNVNLGESLRMAAPTVIALTATIPVLYTIEPAMLRWILAPVVYTATLALVTPVIVGFETLNEMTLTLRKAGFVGALMATVINIDVRVAERIWGFRGR